MTYRYTKFGVRSHFPLFRDLTPFLRAEQHHDVLHLLRLGIDVHATIPIEDRLPLVLNPELRDLATGQFPRWVGRMLAKDHRVEPVLTNAPNDPAAGFDAIDLDHSIAPS